MVMMEGAVLGKVFMIYGAFWVVVLTALFIAVPLLLKGQKRSTGSHGHSEPGSGN